LLKGADRDNVSRIEILPKDSTHNRQASENDEKNTHCRPFAPDDLGPVSPSLFLGRNSSERRIPVYSWIVGKPKVTARKLVRDHLSARAVSVSAYAVMPILCARCAQRMGT
jgi:hypothetical protein